MLAVALGLAFLAAACTSEPAADPGPATGQAAPSGGDAVLATAGAPSLDLTPLPVDPATTIGRLDNGLDYYVRTNDSPGGSVTMRLVIKAGALNEEPRGSGAAHFLEHMMFNGTERFPGNELDATLRRIGVDIGPDFNAYTTDSETVYQMSVDDIGDNVDLAFDVLAQWAAAAIIDPAEVAAEAGVIREEERSRRASGPGVIDSTFDQAYYFGTPWQGVDVLGTADTIGAMSADSLRAFYDTWYRPDNMAVVAVGSRPAAELEQAIADRFGPLVARGSDTTFTVDPTPIRSSPLVDTVIEPTLGDSFVSLDYPLPDWNLGTADGNRLSYTEDVAAAIVDERLNDGLGTGRLDLRTAFAGTFWQTRGLHYMGFNIDADNLVDGTETLVGEIQRSIVDGFTQDELDRAAEAFRAGEDRRLAEAGSIQDASLADAMVDHFLEGADLQSVADSVAMNQSVLDGLTLEDLNSYWQWAMTSQAPILLAVGTSGDRVGLADDHRSALERARNAEIAAVTDDVIPIDELMAAPEPVTEAERTELTHNDGFELRFDNGARVLFSPADFVAAQVSVITRSPGGLLALAPEDRAVASTALDIVSGSGFGPYDPIQVRRYLSDVDADLYPYLDPGTEGFTGGASADDLELLFQQLYLWVTAPRADQVPLNQRVGQVRDYVAQSELDPSFAADLALYQARNQEAGITGLPTGDELDQLTAERALEIFTDRFGGLDGQVVAVVGDVDPDRVVELARRYIGTLPARAGSEPEATVAPAGPVEHRGTAGSGQASGAYRLDFTGRAEESVVNQVLADLTMSLLNDRLFTVVREELGATYGGSSGIAFDDVSDAVDLTISVDGDPKRLDEIARSVEAEIDAIAAGQIAGPDFAEAQAVLRSNYDYVDHGQILDSLLTEAREPSAVIDPVDEVEVLTRTTPGQLADFVARLTTGPDRIDIRVVPTS